MRTKNSLKNSIVGIMAILFEILGQFVLRKLFVLYLGEFLFGTNAIFASIIGVLSVAELGVGSVICFSLYKPIADNDQNDIIALMQIFRKYYRNIGFVILTLGLLTMPFIPYFIDLSQFVGSAQVYIKYIYLIYGFFILDSFLSYFFSYNKIFLVAVQKNYIVNLVRICFATIGTSLVILFMVLSKNYIVYLICWASLRILENMTTYTIARKKYPFLNTKIKHIIEPEKKNKLVKNIKALVFHQIGGTLVLSSDTLIFAKVGGVIAAGVYSNYLMIISGVYKLTQQVFDGIRASFGDFAAQKSKQDTENLFFVLQFIAFIIFTWCSCCILNLCQPAIMLLMGNDDNQFSLGILIVLVLNFFIRGMRLPLDIMKDVKGIYWQDRYKPFLEGLVKISFSIALGIKFGLIGILLGTTISALTVLFTIEPYVVYKYGFEKSSKMYYIKYFKYAVVAAITCTLSVYLSSIFLASGNFYLLILLKFILSTIISISICWIFYFKSEEYITFVGILKKNILKR